MQILFKISLPAALAFAAVSPALADEAPIYVVSQKAFEQWQDDVSSDLSRNLRNASYRQDGRIESGIVQIRFRLDEDGKPTDLSTYSNSTSTTARSIAYRAVRKLHNLDQAPVSGVRDAEFLANVIFARDELEHARLAAKLEQSEQARLASNGAEQRLVALGG